MAEKRKPWGKWYWGDWRKDARLRRCSYAARGLWADMLSLMGGETDQYGYLSMEGDALDAADLAGLLGGSEREVTKLLAELEAKRVLSRVGDDDLPDDVRTLIGPGAPHDTIISRRMIRDKAKEDKDRMNGQQGGNPHVKASAKPPPKPGVNPEDKAQKLEARGQRPEAATPSAEQQVIAIFDEERVKTFGPELARPWPGPKDFAQARAMLAAGATAETCRVVFAAVFQRQRAKGERPADTLGYMANAVRDAITDALLDIPAGLRREPPEPDPYQIEAGRRWPARPDYARRAAEYWQRAAQGKEPIWLASWGDEPGRFDAEATAG